MLVLTGSALGPVPPLLGALDLSEAEALFNPAVHSELASPTPRQRQKDQPEPYGRDLALAHENFDPRRRVESLTTQLAALAGGASNLSLHEELTTTQQLLASKEAELSELNELFCGIERETAAVRAERDEANVRAETATAAAAESEKRRADELAEALRSAQATAARQGGAAGALEARVSQLTTELATARKQLESEREKALSGEMELGRLKVEVTGANEAKERALSDAAFAKQAADEARSQMAAAQSLSGERAREIATLTAEVAALRAAAVEQKRDATSSSRRLRRARSERRRRRGAEERIGGGGDRAACGGRGGGRGADGGGRGGGAGAS